MIAFMYCRVKGKYTGGSYSISSVLAILYRGSILYGYNIAVGHKREGNGTVLPVDSYIAIRTAVLK